VPNSSELALRASKRPTPPERIPRRIPAPALDDHLEVITRAIFQAGLSWAMIDSRWEAFRTGFDRFMVLRVADYGEFDVERLMTTDGIIHSAKKIVGTIENARTLVALDREFGGVSAYIDGFSAYSDLFADARKRFAFLGDLNCYYWLFRTGGPVPPFDEWIAKQPKDHPRMREMVMLGRADGFSSERSGF
jgi:Methyladenine glycosylase